MSELLHELILNSAKRHPGRVALIHKDEHWNYQQLTDALNHFAQFLLGHGLSSGGRVAVYLPKQFETPVALFGAQLAGGVMVPVNPQLKGPQVGHIINDSSSEFLVTSRHRYQQIKEHLNDATSLKAIILIDDPSPQDAQCHYWSLDSHVDTFPPHRRINRDIAALLYTSGSTGKPKGVVLSHLNMVAGAYSVAQYLENHVDDRILSVLPLSFDYGLSQLTTAFLTGASVVLLEYLLPRDVIKAIDKYQITGLAAVPPLWVQLAELPWPDSLESLRYITNSGGTMPKTTLHKLRSKLPNTQPYLMYGLTEAFRSTYLHPSQLDVRPNSIGKAIPNAEILVINSKGELCKPNEPGELVHRGVHVGIGYWNNPEKTAERYRPLPGQEGLLNPELAVWSGDTVKMDEEGYLYFIGRQDDMIKSSGYRISPMEIEEEVHQFEEVAEVAAIGVPHHQLGQAIVLAIQLNNSTTNTTDAILKQCKTKLPNFMQPQHIELYEMLPRNANGKIDRPKLVEEHKQRFQQ
ncbi:acyl-CoA ligase (AMP-forming), exosortase A system-associated [Pleionea sediminis]|uniref:acyl-CoA ligase (AMP-forming), exosortase A system-associated n=1 Tax=Pleionea sediminis TaxID=2569479 RepID=UPI001184A80C|nr:acyl-CoA ligase (AMP-forming), exosortase A system-associated [Pleionea sediminis]